MLMLAPNVESPTLKEDSVVLPKPVTLPPLNKIFPLSNAFRTRKIISPDSWFNASPVAECIVPEDLLECVLT